jgi:hypothetical protein
MKYFCSWRRAKMAIENGKHHDSPITLIHTKPNVAGFQEPPNFLDRR